MAGTTSDTVQRHVGDALEQMPNGRWVAKARDQFPREMKFLGPDGRVPIPVTDSRDASKLGRYEHAVDRFLKTGDTRELEEFEDETIIVEGIELPFLSDPETLERLANAGEVAFEDLYTD